MNKLQRITVVGFASTGMALFGAAAASADVHYSHGSMFAGPHGASAYGLKSFAGEAPHKHKGHHHKSHHKGHHHKSPVVFYQHHGKFAGPHGAGAWATTSAAG